MKKVVYLDNNATTKVAPEVFEAMRPYFTERYGNPSSMHSFGGSVAREVSAARRSLAELLGASPQEIVYTSGGTESDSTAILSALATNPGRREIVATRVEHPAVLNLCKHLARTKGYIVRWLSVDKDGMLDMNEVRNKISDETALVSVMWANNETGVIFPIDEIAEIAQEHGALMHTDAVQVVGKIPIKVSESNINFLALSGHKLHAPKGIGALYIKKGTRFSPFVIGGHQESDRRGGTENVPGIVGLGAAAALARKNLVEENTRVRQLRDRLQKALLERIPACRVNGHLERRLPNTLSIGFEYVEGEAILMRMDEKGICASSGSACTSGSLEPSHVLRAMGVPFTAVHGSIRFSLSRFSTEEEIEFVVRELPGIIEFLRSISPFGRDALSAICTVH
ncbi:MAG: cysteine desulfurase NifS [Desulfomonile tiedjei]|uniref:Cysteine desulfurase n=1 Tax=Desulfomonile tiedjei TaxID=2358 RepID=A0A9D6Z775_9BACT|nr:cysteine desulfurase NifS [Desulfomonile tiedjei]